MTLQAPDLAAVMARLQELEQQNRRLRLAGVMVLILAAAGLLMGQVRPGKAPKVIEAEKFILSDTGGKYRAELKTLVESNRNVVVLDLYDPQGTVLTRLGTGGLFLLDRDAKSRIALNTSTPGAPTLIVSDRDGKGGGIMLHTAPNGISSLSVSDKDGKTIWEAP